jgi:hypothetical protein
VLDGRVDVSVDGVKCVGERGDIWDVEAERVGEG